MTMVLAMAYGHSHGLWPWSVATADGHVIPVAMVCYSLCIFLAGPAASRIFTRFAAAHLCAMCTFMSRHGGRYVLVLAGVQDLHCVDMRDNSMIHVCLKTTMPHAPLSGPPKSSKCEQYV